MINSTHHDVFNHDSRMQTNCETLSSVPDTSNVLLKGSFCGICLHGYCAVPAAAVYTFTSCSLCMLSVSGPRFRSQPGGPHTHKLVLLLLLVGGIKSNPGPIQSLLLSSLNTNGANSKGVLLVDLINESKLDILCVTETKISEKAPNAIKYDMCPPGYGVLHVHRGHGGPTRGGGLAIVYASELAVRTRKTSLRSTSFQLQLVNLKTGPSQTVLANIYRPPSGSKSVFLTELSDVIASVGVDVADRLVLCGDFNMPGSDPDSIDSILQTLFDVRGLEQHVASTTRTDKKTGRENILDLIVSPNTSTVVSDVRVATSHFMSDHAFVTCQVSCRRVKLPPTSYQYRELKQLDMDSFQHRLKNSSLFASSSTTTDEYLDEMERVIGDTLDDLAPLRTATRPGEKGSARWLSPEAVEAKRFRRRLERQWKRTEKESDRRAYRAACWRANKLINESRHQHRLSTDHERCRKLSPSLVRGEELPTHVTSK